MNSTLSTNKNEIFNNLINAKTDVRENLKLGCKSLLVKDFKVYNFVTEAAVGVASSCVPLKTLLEFFEQQNVIENMQLIMKELSLGLFMIITVY